MQKVMVTKLNREKLNLKHYGHNVFFSEIYFVYFIFGHLLNVHFSKQPINNDYVFNNSNTYCFFYLKKSV